MHNLRVASGLLLVCVTAWTPAHAAEPCLDFKWDVSRERAVFAQPSTPLLAGLTAATAPTVALDRLFDVTVAPSESVGYAMPPGKSAAPQSRGGLLRFKVPTRGSYRIALDVGAWIDVVANDILLPTEDFQGQHSCSAPHKIVVFELLAQQWYVLQLSGASVEAVRLSITAAPSRIQ